jgi:tetratricopeptide (TPR) repeat protein
VAYTSEIDKLEARWRENPKGRNFAPLADAYRKAGLIDNAIMLLENGLQLHPDYVSAHIVYARCLIDKKDDAKAQDVFRKVLALDGENVIALRVLAEIAERNSKFEEEVEWLTRLLSADPMNGDAAEALARAKGKAAAKATAAMPQSELGIEHEEPEPSHTTLSTSPSGRPSTAAPEVENFENPISFNPSAHAAAKAEGLEVQEDVELNAQQIEQVEIEGLARTHYEGSGLFKLDAPEPAQNAPSPELDESLPPVDLPLIMPDETAGMASAPPKAAPPPAPKPPPPPAPSPMRGAADDDGAADTATLAKAEPVVTETMAELYLKQGHQQDALRVYQALLAQRPNDARLKNKVEQLSSGGRKGSGVSAQAFLKSILTGGSGKAAPPTADSPSTLTAAFDVAGAGAQTLGEPSRPANDHISLDSVFGEEAARRASAPAPSSQPDAAPAGNSAGSQTGGFSFDEFFAGGKGDQAGGPSGSAGGTAASESVHSAPAEDPSGGPRTPGRSSGRTQRPPEDEVEADQFQQWLKKLKS